jgi:hypothetical protein
MADAAAADTAADETAFNVTASLDDPSETNFPSVFGFISTPPKRTFHQLADSFFDPIVSNLLGLHANFYLHV